MLARGLSVRDIEDAFKGWERPAVVVIEDGGIAIWGAAVGKLSPNARCSYLFLTGQSKNKNGHGVQTKRQ
jgi:hypothetical protein